MWLLNTSRCSRDPKSWATTVPHHGFHYAPNIFITYWLIVGQSAVWWGPSVDIHYFIVFCCVSTFVFGYANIFSPFSAPSQGLFLFGFQVTSSTMDCNILPDCMHSIVVNIMTSVYIDACRLSVCWCTVFTSCSFISQADWTLSHLTDLLEWMVGAERKQTRERLPWHVKRVQYLN